MLVIKSKYDGVITYLTNNNEMFETMVKRILTLLEQRSLKWTLINLRTILYQSLLHPLSVTIEEYM